MELFDTSRIKTFPLKERINNVSIKDVIINPDSTFQESKYIDEIGEITDKILSAKKNRSSVMLTFGAHLIRNGLGLIVIDMIKRGWVTHLATNGAGSIHDWEFAYQGKSCEDVRRYVSEGKFGLWEETGRYINLSLIEGAKNSKGYGESVGRMIHFDKVEDEKVEHPFKKYSIQEAAFDFNIPFTIHPCLGQDIIHTHPLCDFSAIGKVSQIDFLRFVNSVSNLKEGVYLSVGSAVMSPQVFEKTLAMARNVANQQGKTIDNFTICVNDIQNSGDWQRGECEPDKNNPVYYSRPSKTFSRMGAKDMHYIQEDNRIFLHNLYHSLKNKNRKKF